VLISGLGMSAAGEGERADQSGPAPGGVGTDMRGLGAEHVGATDICRSEPLDRGWDSCDGVHMVLQLGDRRCSLRGGKVAGDGADAVARGLGTPVWAGTGEEGPANSLAGL
jgi:hypothetical protein